MIRYDKVGGHPRGMRRHMGLFEEAIDKKNKRQFKKTIAYHRRKQRQDQRQRWWKELRLFKELRRLKRYLMNQYNGE